MNRAEFFQELHHGRTYRLDEMQKMQAAYWLSKEAHRRQTRDDGERYFSHPREVTRLARSFGYDEADTICAGLLHDAREDTYTPTFVYVNLFGHEVWAMIDALSKKSPLHDPLTGKVTGYAKKDEAVYFEALRRASKATRALKCCDRLHNLRSINANWTEARKRKYLKETHDHILPLADATDPEIAKVLRVEVARIEEELANTPVIA